MRNRIVQLRTAGLILLLCVAASIGCSSQQSALRGKWERVTPLLQLGGSYFTNMEQIEFLESGTFVLPRLHNLSGTYSFPQSDRITFESVFGKTTYKFALSSDRLTFEETDKTIEYARIK